MGNFSLNNRNLFSGKHRSMKLVKPKISIVSYLNSKPFIYGFEKTGFSSLAEISLDMPSVCAEKLISGMVDISLVPVAILPQLKKFTIISNYCIGSNGPVDSVLLVSDVPLNEIESIALDYQSRTSVELTKILCRKLWNIAPTFIQSHPDYEKKLGGKQAGVIIGDRALLHRHRFNYSYDLSEEWKKLSGLPFVFATWTSTIALGDNFLSEFNRSIEEGMKLIELISQKEATTDFTKEQIKHYLTHSIDYSFDDKKREAMGLYLQYLEEETDKEKE